MINGQASIIDSQYNIYSLTIGVSNCEGSYSSANGLSMSGLATLDQTTSPAQLEFGVSGSLNGQLLVLA